MEAAEVQSRDSLHALHAQQPNNRTSPVFRPRRRATLNPLHPAKDQLGIRLANGEGEHVPPRSSGFTKL